MRGSGGVRGHRVGRGWDGGLCWSLCTLSNAGLNPHCLLRLLIRVPGSLPYFLLSPFSPRLLPSCSFVLTPPLLSSYSFLFYLHLTPFVLPHLARSYSILLSSYSLTFSITIVFLFYPLFIVLLFFTFFSLTSFLLFTN